MKTYQFLPIVMVAYVAALLVSDITAGKIIQVGMFTVAGSLFMFPFTYIFADILTEVYGYAHARRVAFIALVTSVCAGLYYQLVVVLPVAPGFANGEAFSYVLGGIPRIILGGWIAVWTGAIVNDYIMAKMKIWTRGKHLWARTSVSTFFGEGVNTALFFCIALGGVIPGNLLVTSIISGWLLKTAIEIAMTPATYAVIGYLKRKEGIDHYDTSTNFNPFSLKV